MRDYKSETEKRIAFIRSALADAGADGIVFGNSGGKDSALVGILCRMACENTLGILMPCSSKRNYEEDLKDGRQIASKYDIKTRLFDLTPIKDQFIVSLQNGVSLSQNALVNMAPRIRMMTLYAIAASENRLVAGTGNKSEIYMGYFTKWGDGAFDFNPIADLTVTETYEFLEYLKAPQAVIQKAPSAALFEGQTDEQEMGVTYAAIDAYLTQGNVVKDEEIHIIEGFHQKSEHKRRMPLVYSG